MSTYIALLRGINVSGQKKIRMADLQALYTSAGLQNVVTYLQSGNVIFDSLEQDAAALAHRLEGLVETAFGFKVETFLRTPQDLRRIIETNPFLVSRHEDPAKLHVTFLYSLPEEAQWARLSSKPSGLDEMAAGQQEIFLFCPGGYGTTRLSNSYFENKLKIPATTRNWNTVLALSQLAAQR